MIAWLLIQGKEYNKFSTKAINILSITNQGMLVVDNDTIRQSESEKETPRQERLGDRDRHREER